MVSVQAMAFAVNLEDIFGDNKPKLKLLKGGQLLWNSEEEFISRKIEIHWKELPAEKLFQ